MHPQLYKSRNTGLPTAVNIEHVKPLHCPFDSQSVIAHTFRLPTDIDPGKSALTINTPIMRDLSSAQRATTVIKDKRFDRCVDDLTVTG